MDESDYERISDWLRGKPREVAIIFAVRAVLRGVPSLAFRRFYSNDTRETILPIFRGIHLAWVGAQCTISSQILDETINAVKAVADASERRSRFAGDNFVEYHSTFELSP